MSDKHEILYTSGDVHKAVKRIMSSDGAESFKRVAVVAYLGKNGREFLPNVKDMLIICNPEPGATSPDTIRKLIRANAIVQFSAGLHAKVYWSEKGCVITSANLSQMALGRSPQKEVGIKIDSSDFDIDRFVSSVAPYDITQKSMDDLEIETRDLEKSSGSETKKKKERKTYTSWCMEPFREPWKLGWWETGLEEYSQTAIDKCRNEYNVSEPQEAMNVAKTQAASNEWFLMFHINGNKITHIKWMFADYIVPIPKDDESYEKAYPYQAIQVHGINRYPAPPFDVKGRSFQEPFKAAIKEYGIERINGLKSLIPDQSLLDLIRQKCIDYVEM